MFIKVYPNKLVKNSYIIQVIDYLISMRKIAVFSIS